MEKLKNYKKHSKRDNRSFFLSPSYFLWSTFLNLLLNSLTV